MTRPLLHRHDRTPLPEDGGQGILGRVLVAVVLLVASGAVSVYGVFGKGVAILFAIGAFLALMAARGRMAQQAEEHQFRARNRWFDFCARHPILAYLAASITLGGGLALLIAATEVW